MLDTIKSHISQTQNQYYKLILVVGSPASGTQTLNELGSEFNTPIINLGYELSARLLEVPAKSRPLKVQQTTEDIISDQGSDVVLLDHLEFLFEPSLKQNPLNLLKQLSRNQVVIASWRGEYSDGKITYAIQGHPEYRQYDARDILIISPSNTTHV